MTNDNIVSFNGLHNPHISSDASKNEVLESVKNANLIDIAVVGRNHNGEIQVWSTSNDADRASGLLLRGVNWLTSYIQVQRVE